ncbi:MAG: RIP metalloprotease RseP, partial [Verrucomicrobia bacterium]|nr:RIP metalloprotease RseP [Verrucomicrobiota bacterium]
MSLLYLLLAILGLGFLIFIHELGHYWMARRVGMRVESFGIGFGRPIFSILHNGVKWNICWLPFGGYVKIAGMEKEDGKEPEDIPDGFFGKSPWDRIKVAIMGPLTNLVFAFLAFCVIWLAGGREKHFADVTNKIGSIDPQSELYKAGVRPGDIILKYNNEPVKGSKDHFQAAMISGDTIKVSGLRWDSQKAAYEPFTVQIHPYAHPQSLEPGILTTGVFSGANYVIYPATVNGQKNVLPAASPLIGSGIEPGDRILWVDGEPVYSMAQLSATLNDNKSLLTIERNGKSMLVRVPRVELEDLKLTNQIKEELTDWQYEGD